MMGMLMLLVSSLGAERNGERNNGIIQMERTEIFRTEEGIRIVNLSNARERCNICVMAFPEGKMMSGFERFAEPEVRRSIAVYDLVTETYSSTNLYQAFYRGSSN